MVRTWMIMAGLAAAVPVAPRLLVAQGRPDFSGHWVLAPDESEDPIEKLRGSQVNLGPGRAEPQPDRARPGGRGQGRDLPDPDEVRTARASIREVLVPIEAFRISHARDRIAFEPVSVEDTVIAVTVDGKTVKRHTALGEVELKAEWHGQRIRVERRYKDGPKVEARYALGLGGMKLLVDYKVDADGLPGSFAFRRVYHRVAPTAPSADADGDPSSS